MTNGVPETSLQNHGPKVYGVVQRTGLDRQQEVMAREWTFNHLQDEMRYIREVSTTSSHAYRSTRYFNITSFLLCGLMCLKCLYELSVCIQVRDSLEKVRERMYGQFGGMQQSMRKLSEEMRVINYVISCEPVELPHQTPICEAVNKSENAAHHLFMQAANAHRRSLESEVRIRTVAMESFDQMNSSLISANISLQVTNQSN